MHKFVRNLLTEWRKLRLPFGGKTFIVAVSGGADSVSLSLALDDLRRRKKLDLHFVVAHFNHDLRGAQSVRDSEFVKDLAERLEFECVIKKGAVSKKGNLEQNARFARYRFLIETAQNCKAFGILTAHTLNDQAETFLLNLIRGSGIEGLSAMKPLITNYELRITNYELKSEIALVRPLLNWAKREETEDFCRHNHIEFRQDAMNDELQFRRVRIRKKLLPALREFNPKIIETLARTANLFQNEIESALETEAREPATESQSLRLRDLRLLSKPSLYKALREWLKANRGTLRRIDSKHLEAIDHLIFSRKSGRVVELPAGERVVKEKGKLFWVKKNIENIE